MTVECKKSHGHTKYVKYAIYRISTIQNTIKFSCTVYKLFLNIRNSLMDFEGKN
jgi:hypothetical protein